MPHSSAPSFYGSIPYFPQICKPPHGFTAPSPLLGHFPHPGEVEKADVPVVVGAQRPVVRVVAVGGDEHVGGLKGRLAEQVHHNRRVVPVFPVKGELHHVAGQQLFDRCRLGHGPHALRRPRHKVVKIRHPRPGGGLVVGANVVPPQVLGVVHHPAARVDALGGKIGAVPADVLVVIKCRISAVSPPPGVLHRRRPVVREQSGLQIVHREIPPSAQCMRGQSALFPVRLPRAPVLSPKPSKYFCRAY